jgi:hypothetical protein
MTIIMVTKQGNSVSVKKQAVLRVKIAQFNIPAGILTNNFTAKGTLLVGTGPGTFVELPPAEDGKALVYNASSASGFSSSTLEGAFPPLFKQGFKLSNNASDANNDIDIGTGTCRDSADVFNFRLTTGVTKRLDAAWAAGTNQGGLDTGSKANSTWYHVWIIRKNTDGTLDALFSTSATAPTMPTGYTYKRRVGAVKTDGSGNILAFYQHGNRFMWKTVVGDLSAGTQTSATAFTVSVPLGVKVAVIGAAQANNAASFIVVFDPDSTTTSVYYTAGSSSTGYIMVYSNVSSQLKYYVNSNAGYWYTFGWEELWES